MLHKTLFAVGAAAAIITAALLGSGSSNTAVAHERRALGKYTMVVGFLTEPAYVNQSNGLDLRVFTLPPGLDPAQAKSTDRIGTAGLDKTLKAEVSVGGESKKMALTLEPRFNDTGAYNGHFFPTQVGDYTYHVFGTIEGMNVDESFTSKPDGGFSAVEDVADLQFPAKVASSQDLSAQVDSLEGEVRQLTADASSSDGDSDNVATVLAIVGIVIAVAALGAGGVALMRGRS